MAFNVMNFENFVRSFMIERIKERQPELDMSENSVFDDVFIKPMIEVLTPFVDLVNSMEFKMNLANAENMSEEDLDDIGINNYLTIRNPGRKASGTVSISFSRITPGETVVIPEGVSFSTSDGLVYVVSERKELSYDEMLSKYNPATMTYNVDVVVYAAEIGINYNVDENRITIITSKFHSGLVGVTNHSAITSGQDKENNSSYAKRIREFYISRHIGTKPGYKNYILENFKEITGIYIAGYRDPEMMRDLFIAIDPLRDTTTTTLYLLNHGLENGDFIINHGTDLTLMTEKGHVVVSKINNHELSHSAILGQTVGDLVVSFETISLEKAEAGTDSDTIVKEDHGLSAGDWIFNITRDAVAEVDTVDDDDTVSMVTPIADQASGDDLLFLSGSSKKIAFAQHYIKEDHMGGKVDFYLRGCEYELTSVVVEVPTDNLILLEAYNLIDTGSIVVENLTDIGKTPVFSTVEDPATVCKIILDNTADQSYDSGKMSDIRVTYLYSDGIETLTGTEVFKVGKLVTELSVPFKDIASIYEEEDVSKSYSGSEYYDLTRYDLDGNQIYAGNIYIGTSRERVFVELKNLSSLNNGTRVVVSYSVNKTLMGIRSNFDIEENRTVTAGLLFREATPVFVNIGFDIKMEPGQILDDSKTTKINNLLSDYFISLPLGGRADESDIVGQIYRDSEISSFVDYVSLPLKSFYIPADPSDPITETRDGTFIQADNLSYLVLNKVNITQI